DNANFSFLKYETGHDTHFSLAGSNNTRTVRANQAAITSFDIFTCFNHILNRNTFGNTNNYLNTCFGCFHDGIGSKCRWYKNDRSIRTGFFYGIFYGVKYRAIQMRAATFPRGYPTYNLCAILNHLAGVEAAFRAGKTLYNYF